MKHISLSHILNSLPAPSPLPFLIPCAVFRTTHPCFLFSLKIHVLNLSVNIECICAKMGFLCFLKVFIQSDMSKVSLVGSSHLRAPQIRFSFFHENVRCPLMVYSLGQPLYPATFENHSLAATYRGAGSSE